MSEQKTQQPISRIRTVQADLFSSSDALAHCVSLDFKMGAGIAREFRSRFGQVEGLKRQVTKFPGLAILHDKIKNRFIYYLVTKERYFHKPTYESLTSSLGLLKQHMVENKILKLSIPCLGCGLDKLEWSRVQGIIENVFEDTMIEITVYVV